MLNFLRIENFIYGGLLSITPLQKKPYCMHAHEYVHGMSMNNDAKNDPKIPRHDFPYHPFWIFI